MNQLQPNPGTWKDKEEFPFMSEQGVRGTASYQVTYYTQEQADAMANVEQPQERPTKRTVAISRDGVTTIFDAAWLNIMRTQDDGSMYGNNTQG